MSAKKDWALDLIGKVYDAALDESKWQSFLEMFAKSVGGCSSMLRTANIQSNEASFVNNFGYDPAWREAFCNHYFELDYLTPACNQLEIGEIYVSDQHMSLSAQRKTEFYNDYLLPQGKQHSMGTILYKESHNSLLFAVQRDKRANTFGEEEVELISLLVPHVTRAVQVHRRLSSLAIEKEWALGALDQLRMGVILTDSRGAPLFLNETAEKMQSSWQGVDISQGRLSLSGVAETSMLRKLIADAAQGVCGGDMRIPLSNGEFLHCMVMPVTDELVGRWDIPVASGCAAVFLSRPGALQLSPERLPVLYGLSPAEAKLASSLVALKNLEQTAIDSGIAISTARAQLRSIFDKTGARSQPELLMLMATGTLAHCCDE